MANAKRTAGSPKNGPAVKRTRREDREWSPFQASKFSQRVCNPIRSIVDTIKRPEKTTKEMIPLSLGDPTVFGNFPPSDVLVQTIVANVNSGKCNGYAHSAGTPAARAAIAARYTSKESPLTPADIVIASGCSGALDLAINGLLNPGQNLLVPQPGFSLYQTLAEAHGMSVRHYRLLPEHSWQADLKDMESLIDDDTGAILVNNPSNPCGSVFALDHLKAISALAARHRLPIIADEIYGNMSFDGHSFHSLGTVSLEAPVLVCGGLAKEFLVPGWRVGWVCVHDRNGLFEDVRKGLFRLSQMILGANSLVQSVIPTLLSPNEGSKEQRSLRLFQKKTMTQLQSNAMFTVQELQDVEGLRVVRPQGAMYVMVGIEVDVFEGFDNDMSFCQQLLEEESVFVLPGKCFGAPNFFRIVFTAPREKLALAYARIKGFCERRRK
jgi:tyrosine aminotransferase